MARVSDVISLVIAITWTVQAMSSNSMLDSMKDLIIRKNRKRSTLVLTRQELGTDSCKTYDYNLTVSQPNCISKTITVKYCYGKCSSVYLPSTRKKQNPLTFCQICKPESYRWRVVYLKCNKNLVQTSRKTKVQVIQSCACATCRPSWN